MDKEEEFEFSAHFINKLNKIYGMRYFAIRNDDEGRKDTDTDIYGVSESDFPSKIHIQCVSMNGDFLYMMDKQRKKFERREALKIEDTTLITNIKMLVKKLINDKEKEYSNPQDLILLVMNPRTYELSEKDCLHVKEILGNYENSKFSGIYFVNPRVHIMDKARIPYKRQIIVLKSMFNDSRVIL